MAMVTTLARVRNPHEQSEYQTSLWLSRLIKNLIENLGHGAQELRGSGRGDEDRQAVRIRLDLGVGVDEVKVLRLALFVGDFQIEEDDSLVTGSLLGGAEVGEGNGHIILAAGGAGDGLELDLIGGDGEKGSVSAGQRMVMADGEGDGGTGLDGLDGGGDEEVPLFLFVVDGGK